MPISALIVLAAAAQASAPPINIVGHPWAPFISPMGEPFRARTAADNTLALWFQQADRNHDGLLAPGEMQADAERFFARLDRNHDGEIDPEELVAYEYEVAPEIQVNSKWRRPRGQVASEAQASEDARPADAKRRRARPIEGYDPTDPIQGAARYALLNIPEPVAAADADLNRSITLSEFKQAAIYRFRLLDTRHTGQLSLAELESLVPQAPPPGKRPKRRANEPDARVGVPLPPGD